MQVQIFLFLTMVIKSHIFLILYKMIKRIYEQKHPKPQHLQITANKINKSSYKNQQENQLIVSLYEPPRSSLSYSQQKKNRNKHSSSSNRASRKQFTLEYERKIQNSRILRRIMYPKRDKMIMNSTKMLGTNKSNFHYFARTQSSHLKRSHLRNFNEQMDHKSKNYNQENNRIKEQNHRMAKRIIDAKPFLSNTKCFRKKLLNHGIKSFLDEQKNLGQKCQIETSEPPIATISLNNLKPIYGYGPTIIQITSFELNCIPNLKNEDLISLELMPSEKLSNSRDLAIKNSRYITPGVEYQVLKNRSIKFAVRMKNIGQFVPLKIWKFDGIRVIDMGIFDIQFGNYLSQRIQRGEKCVNSCRIDEKNEAYLRKEGNHQSRNSIQIEYKIYSKKYMSV